MLSKLALGGLKNRFRDYAVLFSGLVIASAVFYMFMALATNTSFLKKNSHRLHPVYFRVRGSFAGDYHVSLYCVRQQLFAQYASTRLCDVHDAGRKRA